MCKKLLTIALLLCVLIGFTGCFEDGDNASTYRTIAVVGNKSTMGGKTLLTSDGEFASSTIASSPTLNYRDCIYVEFKINFDDQPSKDYFTATEVNVLGLIDNYDVDFVNEEGSDLYADYDMTFEEVFCATNIHYDGQVFIEKYYKMDKTTEADFVMYCDPDNKDSDGVYTVYVVGKYEKEPVGTSLGNNITSFDFLNFVRMHGKSETLEYTGYDPISVRTLSINIKYPYEKDKDGNLEYRAVKTSTGGPIKITVRS